MIEKNILFFLGTIGLTLLIVKSKLFISLRSNVTLWHDKKRWKILWFFDSILNCPMCFSVWGAIPCYLLNYYGYNVVLYILSAVAATSLYFSVWKR